MMNRPFFPRKTITELGEEKLCLCCGEYWPADTEFFAHQQSSKDRLSSRCIACIQAKVWHFFKAPANNSLQAR